MLAIIGWHRADTARQSRCLASPVVRTPYGSLPGPLTFGAIRGVPVVFLGATATPPISAPPSELPRQPLGA